MVQQIEKTDKKWKIWHLVGVLTFVLGMGSCSLAAGAPPGAVSGGMAITAGIWVFSLCCVLYAKIGAWWHHG